MQLSVYQCSVSIKYKCLTVPIIEGGGEMGSMYVLSYQVRWSIHIYKYIAAVCPRLDNSLHSIVLYVHILCYIYLINFSDLFVGCIFRPALCVLHCCVFLSAFGWLVIDCYILSRYDVVFKYPQKFKKCLKMEGSKFSR